MNAVKTAITHGYRSIDTAAIYANEKGVGQGIREGIAAIPKSTKEHRIDGLNQNHRVGPDPDNFDF